MNQLDVCLILNKMEENIIYAKIKNISRNISDFHV